MTLLDLKVASKLVPNWEPPRIARNFIQIQRRIGQQRRHRRVAMSMAALVASVSLLWFGFGWWHAQTVRDAPAVAAAQTRFNDGSTATALTAGAVLEVEKTSDSEIVVSAKNGKYRFDVVPNSARQFVVQIADVTVRVLGTEFVVSFGHGVRR